MSDQEIPAEEPATPEVAPAPAPPPPAPVAKKPEPMMEVPVSLVKIAARCHLLDAKKKGDVAAAFAELLGS